MNVSSIRIRRHVHQLTLTLLDLPSVLHRGKGVKASDRHIALYTSKLADSSANSYSPDTQASFQFFNNSFFFRWFLFVIPAAARIRFTWTDHIIRRVDDFHAVLCLCGCEWRHCVRQTAVHQNCRVRVFLSHTDSECACACFFFTSDLKRWYLIY